ncbi:MAG TPA: efflux RND transporter periplasmic adaptor subunit [Acetobacteraceae bacterium]
MELAPVSEKSVSSPIGYSRPASVLRPHRLGRVALGIIIIGAAGTGVAYWRHWWPFTPTPHAAAAPPPVPVQTAKVVQQAVPIWVTGLGAVQAYNTVTIRARVDGQLVRVAYREGQDVKQGDLLAEIDPHPFEAQLAQARAKFAQDQAQLVNSRLQQGRYADLVGKQDVAKSTLDTQVATTDSAAAQVQADQAAIAYAAVQLGYTKITAPIGGRTGVRLVDEGNIVHAADTGGLVVITQLQPISVLFSLPQDSLARVQAAIAASPTPLQVQAFGRDLSKPLATGKLELVNNQVNQATGTVDVKATFPNDDHALWPGQFVTARLTLNTRQDGLTAPAAAVQRGPDGTYVYVVGADGTASMKPVELGLMRDGMALFDKGVAPGDTLITAGQFKVKPGAKVAEAKPEDAKAAVGTGPSK